ncbi:MAG: DUF523 and DUF1722 domain-containing protein [Candidatus Cloacimonadales bacterium]
MRQKPRIVISKCLEFAACRWNGLAISNPIVKQLKDYVEFIPICPEVEIGLGIPRDPIRLIEKADEQLILADSTTGEECTEKMQKFSKEFLRTLPEVEGFIMKTRSPSCGLNNVKVYPKAGKAMVKHAKGVGIFAQNIKNDFSFVALEDEGRLLNLMIREHFLTKAFTILRYHNLPQSMKALIEFHANHKYLFMAYNQAELKVAGKIVANHQHLPPETVFAEYEKSLEKILYGLPQKSTHINVLQHIFGYFSDELNAAEKSLFLGLLEQYRQLQIPLVALTAMLHSWAARFQKDYLLQQVYLQPYPKELQTIFDSGKGRMYET